MCLIKGKEDSLCLHPTCIQSKDEPNFWYNTKSAMFLKKNDFNKIHVFTVADSSLSYLKPINPHKRSSLAHGNHLRFSSKHVNFKFRDIGQLARCFQNSTLILSISYLADVFPYTIH